MNYLKTIFFIFPLIWLQWPEKFEFQKTIQAKADFFEVDALGNIYLVRNSKLIKINPQGEKLCEYSNPLLGDIASIDVSDPLRLFVFYRESNQIQFLNNALAEITSPIRFDDYGIYSVQAACSSSQNRFWIFDPTTLQLVQYDQNMGIVQKSPAIDQIIECDCLPNLMFEKQNQVFLNCPWYGVLVFDQFGSFSKKFPEKGMISFCVEGEDYYYQVGPYYFKYSLTKLLGEKVSVPSSKNPKQIKQMNGKLYLLSDEDISVFSCPQP